MKRGFPLLGGFGITWAMLLRVFPGALIIGVSIKMAWSLITKRRLSRQHIRIIVGCTLGLVVLVSASIATFGTTEVYNEFLRNSFKHKDTKLTNHMGLPTLMSYHPSYVVESRNNTKKDPFKKWKDMRGQLKRDRFYSCIALALHWDDRTSAGEWRMPSVRYSSGFELTCYYYSFLILLALVAARRGIYAVAMTAMVIMGQVIRLTHGWYDEQYTWESLIVVITQIIILVGLCIETYKADKRDKEMSRATPRPGPTLPVASSQAGEEALNSTPPSDDVSAGHDEPEEVDKTSKGEDEAKETSDVTPVPEPA